MYMGGSYMQGAVRGGIEYNLGCALSGMGECRPSTEIDMENKLDRHWPKVKNLLKQCPG